MTLSIGAATDHIYALAQQAVTGVTVNGVDMVAVDGEPDVLTFGGMFIVGSTEPPPNGSSDTSGQRAQLTADTPATSETYVIPSYIEIRVPGRVQKTARDLAIGVFDTFAALLYADQTLGGALKNGEAEITDLNSTPGNVGTAAEPGRRQRISFGVSCAAL